MKQKKRYKEFKKLAKKEVKGIKGSKKYNAFDCFNQKYIYDPLKLNEFYDSFYEQCIPTKWQKVQFDGAKIEKELTALFNQKSYQCFSQNSNSEISFEELKKSKAVYVEWSTEEEFELFFCNDFELENPKLPSYEDWPAQWDYSVSLVDIKHLFAYYEDEEIFEEENNKVRKALLRYINGKLLSCVILAWKHSQLSNFPIGFALHDADMVVALPKDLKKKYLDA